MTGYVCSELVAQNGEVICKTWQALDADPSLPLSKQEANQITVAVCSVLILVWGFKQAKKLIR